MKNRLLDTVGEREGGVMGENSIETYTLQYAIQIASGNLLYDAGNPTLSFPHCVQKSVLHACISFAALQVGSSVLFF